MPSPQACKQPTMPVLVPSSPPTWAPNARGVLSAEGLKGYNFAEGTGRRVDRSAWSGILWQVLVSTAERSNVATK